MNHSPMTQFFYLLMRDKLPTADVESTMNKVRACVGKDVTHSAPHLEAYAQDLATELQNLQTASAKLLEEQQHGPVYFLTQNQLRRLVEHIAAVDKYVPEFSQTVGGRTSEELAADSCREDHNQWKRILTDMQKVST